MYCSARAEVRDTGLLSRRGLLVGVILLEVHGEELHRVFRPFLHLKRLRRVSHPGSRDGRLPWTHQRGHALAQQRDHRTLEVLPDPRRRQAQLGVDLHRRLLRRRPQLRVGVAHGRADRGGGRLRRRLCWARRPLRRSGSRSWAFSAFGGRGLRWGSVRGGPAVSACGNTARGMGGMPRCPPTLGGPAAPAGGTSSLLPRHRGGGGGGGLAGGGGGGQGSPRASTQTATTTPPRTVPPGPARARPLPSRATRGGGRARGRAAAGPCGARLHVSPAGVSAAAAAGIGAVSSAIPRSVTGACVLASYSSSSVPCEQAGRKTASGVAERERRERAASDARPSSTCRPSRSRSRRSDGRVRPRSYSSSSVPCEQTGRQEDCSGCLPKGRGEGEAGRPEGARRPSTRVPAGLPGRPPPPPPGTLGGSPPRRADRTAGECQAQGGGGGGRSRPTLVSMDAEKWKAKLAEAKETKVLNLRCAAGPPDVASPRHPRGPAAPCSTNPSIHPFHPERNVPTPGPPRPLLPSAAPPDLTAPRAPRRHAATRSWMRCRPPSSSR